MGREKGLVLGENDSKISEEIIITAETKNSLEDYIRLVDGSADSAENSG